MFHHHLYTFTNGGKTLLSKTLHWPQEKVEYVHAPRQEDPGTVLRTKLAVTFPERRPDAWMLSGQLSLLELHLSLISLRGGWRSTVAGSCLLPLACGRVFRKGLVSDGDPGWGGAYPSFPPSSLPHGLCENHHFYRTLLPPVLSISARRSLWVGREQQKGLRHVLVII